MRGGDQGSLTLFGDNPTRHRLFADHLWADYRVQTSGRGRTVDEWKMRPEQSDNQWLDGLVGCAVGASIQGTSLLGEKASGGRTVRTFELPGHARARLVMVDARSRTYRHKTASDNPDRYSTPFVRTCKEG